MEKDVTAQRSVMKVIWKSYCFLFGISLTEDYFLQFLTTEYLIFWKNSYFPFKMGKGIFLSVSNTKSTFLIVYKKKNPYTSK